MRTTRATVVVLAGAATLAMPASAAARNDHDDARTAGPPATVLLRAPAGGGVASVIAHQRAHRADRLRTRAIHLARALDRAQGHKVRTHGERRLVRRAAVPRLHHRVHVLRHKLAAARAPAPVPASTSTSTSSTPAATGSTASSTLQAIAACESGGNPSAIGGGGAYRGKYQFDEQTWQSVGGTGDPAAASESEQDYRASLLYSREGATPWPVCGR